MYSKVWSDARHELHKRYLSMNDAELKRLVRRQMAKEGGTPVPHMFSETDPAVEAMFNDNPVLHKALTSTSGSAMIRQDLEAPLYALFVRKFPWLERLMKEPANGITHTSVQMTSPGSETDAQLTVSETGTVNDDTAVYQRALFPIGVFAVRRGVSLKAQYATIAGGADFNPENQEISAGVISLAGAVQRMLLQGNSSYSAATSATLEAGAYNANGFDGLRQILGQRGNYASGGSTPSNSIIIDEDAAASFGNPTNTNFPITSAVQWAAAQIWNAGGSPSIILTSANTGFKLDNEQQQIMRAMNSARGSIEVIPGVHAQLLTTGGGQLPILPIPGSAAGHYLRDRKYDGSVDTDNTDVEDIYVLDEEGLSIVYLGNEALTILEIPVGVNGQLTSLFIPFLMYGFKIATPLWQAKIRVPR